ncbi:hypothetical protein PIB30_094948 [Stylosanthes scabra]|uniref:Uncharacterized protein n=1 Tax=Stylosanthes scabra TaxID=79078 RepID=A0ABU6ZUL8_9FABA|nr:hypothetical protein [Stylosanthes scabra]
MYALALRGKTSPKLLTSHSITLISNSIAWSFIPRGNDTHFTVVLLVRFGALAEIGAYQLSGILDLLERLDFVESERALRQPFKLEPVPEKSDNIRNENPQPMDSQYR